MSAHSPSYKYRPKALEEYGGECQLCGSTTRVQVHHIDGDGSNNELSNLVPLCAKHHHQAHTGTPFATGYYKYSEAICWYSWQLEGGRFSKLYGDCPITRDEIEIGDMQDKYLDRLVWFEPTVNNRSQAVQYCINTIRQRDVINEEHDND